MENKEKQVRKIAQRVMTKYKLHNFDEPVIEHL